MTERAMNLMAKQDPSRILLSPEEAEAQAAQMLHGHEVRWTLPEFTDDLLMLTDGETLDLAINLQQTILTIWRPMVRAALDQLATVTKQSREWESRLNRLQTQNHLLTQEIRELRRRLRAHGDFT
jgi:hypothetical protein